MPQATEPNLERTGSGEQDQKNWTRTLCGQRGLWSTLNGPVCFIRQSTWLMQVNKLKWTKPAQSLGQLGVRISLHLDRNLGAKEKKVSTEPKTGSDGPINNG